MQGPQWTPRLSTGMLVFLMLVLLGMAGCRTTWEGQDGVEAPRPLPEGSRAEDAADHDGRLEQAGIVEPAKMPAVLEKKWRRGGPKRRADAPDQAAELFALKRVPEGETAIPVERYAAATEHARQMPQQSTATETMWPSRAEMDLTTDADAALLGTWTYLGPGNIGGRTRGLLIDPLTPSTIYAAGVAGGVWKTTNGGQAWMPLMDSVANLAVASLAMDPSNTSILYAGTGEGVFNGDAVRGAGIFKTTNAGAAWQQLASTNTANFHYVNKIVVSPNNGRRVYAATRTGVWRSLNGGSTWSRVLNPGAVNGCLDLAIRTDQTTDYIFAACGTFVQATVYRNVQAEGSGTWTAVLTESGMGRTTLAIAPSNQSIIYALAASVASGQFQHGLHAVFRSTSSGDAGTWTARVRNSNATKLNTVLLTNPVFAFLQECGFGSSSSYFNQGWYDNVIAVDPADANRVWVGGIDLFRSDDGGANWGMAGHWWADRTAPRYVHADIHALVFHPQYNGTTNRTLFVGNDGGLFKTTNARAAVATGPTAPCNTNNGNVTWTTLNNGYGVTQFYHGLPYPDGTTYFGGTQDNGTLRGMDSTGSNSWTTLLGGDGGYVAVDPANPNTIYAENTGLSIQKSTNGGTDFSEAVSGVSGDDGFLFIAPFAMDPGNAGRLWTGGFYVWRTTNGAANWSRASAAVPDGQVSALSIHPANSNTILVGTSAGYILRTSTGLADGPTTTWANVRPRSGYVSSLTFHPTNTNIAYATYSTFGGTHVWRSTDGGATWTDRDGSGTTGLPDVPVHAVVVDPSNTSRLYIGTDIGVFSSIDSGVTWAIENTGFANVITESLAVGTRTGQAQLFAFTHGRGVWRVGLGSTGNHTLTVTKVGSGRVTSRPAGINCGSTCTAAFAQGRNVTLTASAASGATFRGWSGACSGTGACTVAMTRPRSVTATFSTVGAAPTATTRPASGVTTHEAHLRGTVNPNGLATTVFFQWGTSTAYGSTTPSRSIGNGTSNVAVAANLRGLSPRTIYHYRVVATNDTATRRGKNQSFTTSSGSTAILQDDMENGPGSWFPESPWALTTATSSSPTHSWTDSPEGNYADNANVSLWSPVLNFSGLSAVTLTFRHRFDLENAFDFGNVWVTTDNGFNFTQMASFTGANTTWTQATMNLNAFAGQPSVRIVWQLLSDGSVTRDGWYIDDVLVSDR